MKLVGHVSDQTSFACDLYRPVAEHFDGIPALSRPIRENRDYCSFGVVAERLIDLVTDYKFGHGGSFRPQALRPVRFKYGFFAIGKTDPGQSE
jgi:hypothetical protein